MPVKLTSAAPGEWPAHLAPVGAEPRRVSYAEVHEPDPPKRQRKRVQPEWKFRKTLRPLPWSARRRLYLERCQPT